MSDSDDSKNHDSGYNSSNRTGKKRGPYKKKLKTVDEDNSHDESNDLNDHTIPTGISLFLAPAKSSNLFTILVLPRKYDNELKREDLFDELCKTSVFQCIVAMEKNLLVNSTQQSKYRSAHQFKIFLNFAQFQGDRSNTQTSLYVFNLINNILRKKLGEEQKIPTNDTTIKDSDQLPEIQIFSVSNRNDAITWTTKNDGDVRYKNCDVSEFSSFYLDLQWCRANVDEVYFPEANEYVINSNHSDKLQKMFNEYQLKHHQPYKNKKSILPDFGDWRDLFKNWWNGWVPDEGKRMEDVWHLKKKQCLIVGGPDVGKTSLVNFYLRDHPEWAIFIPNSGSNSRNISDFAFSNARPSFNSVAFIDEFKASAFDPEKLKIILQGSSFTPQIKHKQTCQQIQLKFPMIFLSNHPLPDSSKFDGLRERFFIINIPNSAKKHAPTVNPYEQYLSLPEQHAGTSAELSRDSCIEELPKSAESIVLSPALQTTRSRTNSDSNDFSLPATPGKSTRDLIQSIDGEIRIAEKFVEESAKTANPEEELNLGSFLDLPTFEFVS